MIRLTERLSPRALKIVLLLAEHKTYQKLQEADSTITDAELRSAQAELLGLLGIGDATAEGLFEQAMAARKPKLRSNAARKKSPDGAYQIKITLRGSKPPIWRRFIVPGSIRLDKLHQVIQQVMGWYDCHLHQFLIDGENYVQRAHEGMDIDMDGRDETKFRLRDVVKEPKHRFDYEYDFGDGWDHSLTVEKIIPGADAPQTMVCLAGKGRCPMEDCGGLWGWYRLIKVLNNPGHEEHAELKEWAGGAIDPDEFDAAEVTKVLQSMRPGK